MMSRLPFGCANILGEALRYECDTLLEEKHPEEQKKRLDQLSENDSVLTVLAATPDEKKMLPCFNRKIPDLLKKSFLTRM